LPPRSVLHSRWPIFGALVAGGLAVALFWYVVLANPSGEAVPASGGSYTEGVTRAPERMNPLFPGTNQTDADIAALVFSGLVRLGPDGTPQPDLAERWEITGNGQNYIFHLRRGVAWHDGESFDSEDVAFTFRAIADPAFKGDPALHELMQGVVVTARDPQTVEFRLEQTYAPFLAYMTVGILPAHLLRRLDANQLFNAPFNQRPVGTGPYSFDARTDDGVDLEANGTYHLGPPRISRFRFRVYGDAAQLASALRSGAIDGALFSDDAADSDVAFFEGDRRFTAHRLTATTHYMLYLKTSDPNASDAKTNAPPFSDHDVRQALLQSLDIDAIINDVAGGHGQRIDTGIPRQAWAYTEQALPPYDAGAAATALEKAGWARDSDGVRRKGAQRLEFTIAVADEPRQVAIAREVARQWEVAGVRANVQPYSPPSFVEEHLLPRQFDAALVAVAPGPDPDPYPFWHSSQTEPPGRNLSGFVDTRIDDALERARQTTDVARRRELYALFSGYWLTDLPAIPLFAPVHVYAQNTRVRGVGEGLLFTPSARFANVQEWYVNTRVE